MENLAGADTVRQVMTGNEVITASSKPAKVAVWVQGAMERLDRLVDAETRNRIMNRCGVNCAAAHQEVIRLAKNRRTKAGNLEAFLTEEERNPPAGTRLQRQGEVWFQYYAPHDYSRPMRCFCSLMSGLPEGQTVSATFCQCSVGFVRAYWEALLDQPVEVELVQSAVTGAEECKFRISAMPEETTSPGMR
ncbi:MAG: DUF6144 family protein [Coprothermobacterota bacterium]|nr:DUF6144 family protein [Coprothermobacterota bacterium]